jgi:hypothetical protein
MKQGLTATKAMYSGGNAERKEGFLTSLHNSKAV